MLQDGGLDGSDVQLKSKVPTDLVQQAQYLPLQLASDKEQTKWVFKYLVWAAFCRLDWWRGSTPLLLLFSCISCMQCRQLVSDIREALENPTFDEVIISADFPL